MDDDFLPIPDACVHWGCGKPEAEHVGWRNGGPSHDYERAEPVPKPERVAGSHIETTWTCTHCGEACDVWGVAEGWMDCPECGKGSYLVFLG